MLSPLFSSLWEREREVAGRRREQRMRGGFFRDGGFGCEFIRLCDCSSCHTCCANKRCSDQFTRNYFSLRVRTHRSLAGAQLKPEQNFVWTNFKWVDRALETFRTWYVKRLRIEQIPEFYVYEMFKYIFKVTSVANKDDRTRVYSKSYIIGPGLHDAGSCYFFLKKKKG